MTKDSVTVAVDAVVYYNIRLFVFTYIILVPFAQKLKLILILFIRNPMAAVCNVSDYSKSTKLLASTTLR